MQYYDNVLQVVGHTPLVRLRRVIEGLDVILLAKVESMNPGGSVKDRIGLAMIEDAEGKGLLRPGGTISGAVVTRDDRLHAAMQFYQNSAGGVPGPFDAWLTLRGLKTLSLRMRQHCVNAQAVAEFLSQHPRVRQVYYPGLAGHPQHELARRQMDGAGGMVSFVVAGGREQANTFLKALKVISLAESLGGVESLACHPATMTHGSVPAEERQRRGIGEGLVRLSVGVEDSEDLLEDLDQALRAR